ncbi:Eco57I restriction-modification methylase domain-containing protein [Xanthomonas sacchari]|nr:Eco57I restriction-modification methylase domain-containing protein [Xanthomonas sacchari]
MNGELQLGEFAETLKLLRMENSANEAQIVQKDPRSVVYGVLTRDDRREQGIFFSGEAWAQRMVSLVDVSRWDRFIDPSAGIGDLLLALAQRLPLSSRLDATLETWAKMMQAVDLRASFLEIAWTRIRAVALSRHANLKASSSHAFSICDEEIYDMPASFRAADALNVNFELKPRDCIIMNPPYQRMLAPKMSLVGTGLRTAAGLHLEHILKQAPAGVGIVALIPDVIRSGSSYRNFRESLAQNLDIRMLESGGHFGDSADVDVAILVGVTRSKSVVRKESNDISLGSELTLTLDDVASVRVGPVVPHRTGQKGQRLGYLTTKNIPVDAEMLEPSEFATYDARLEKAPFLVVRRTSSPSDRRRARASIVRGSGWWLVENHLIVVKPKAQTLDECRRIHAFLSDARTDVWLNKVIRCRHLTVSAIKSLPLWGRLTSVR